MPRPTKLTDQVEALILDALRRGNTRTAAAEAAGLARETVSRWIARNAAFRHAVTRAEAEAEIKAVGRVDDAAEGGSWQASAWWLERRRHADWGKVDRVELEIRKVAEVVAAETGADPDWLVKRAAEIVARAQRAEAT